jgi:hypothetical protein
MSEEGVRRVALEDRWDYCEKRVPLGIAAGRDLRPHIEALALAPFPALERKIRDRAVS